MTESETAWIAGLLEGEGCFALSRKNIQIICAMTDEDVIQKLHRIAGGRISARPAPRPNTKPIWYWRISTRTEAVALLVAIYPHLGLRRKGKVEDLLSFHAANPLLIAPKGTKAKTP